MSKNSVAVIILNWNGWRDTLACLESLRHSSSETFTIYVVDNGSTDDSLQKLESVKDIILVKNKTNFGFAKGCNSGIRAAIEDGFEYIWLLNNDTVVCKGALDSLLTTATENSSLAAIGSVIYRNIEHRKLEVWGGSKLCPNLGLAWRLTSAGDLDYICGASMFLRTTALCDVGMLDEDFFMYWEDADLCKRLTARGWKLGVAEESLLEHKGSASTSKIPNAKIQMRAESQVIFCNRYALIPVFAIAFDAVVQMLIGFAQGNFRSIGFHIAGLRAGRAKVKTSNQNGNEF